MKQNVICFNAEMREVSKKKLRPICMLEVYQEPSVGPQASSLRKTFPIYSLPKGTRSERERVFISHDHDKLSGDKDSPGPIYDISSTVGKARMAKFGSAPQRELQKSQSADSSIDLLGGLPDRQRVRFRSTKSTHFGSDTRNVIKNAAILKSHPQAFFGVHSPGPAAYSLVDGMGTQGRMVSMTTKTKILGSNSQTPEGVGPGCYETPGSCGVVQFQSRIANQPVFSFGSGKQRPEPTVSAVRMLNEIKSPAAVGRQVSSTKKSAPTAVLGSQTRDQWRRIEIVSSPLDRIQTECRRPRIAHANVPVRMEIIRWSS